MLAAEAWPRRTAVQTHYAADDPFRHDDLLESVAHSVRESGALLEIYAEYLIDGHLFTNPDQPHFAADAAEQFWERAVAFLKD